MLPRDRFGAAPTLADGALTRHGHRGSAGTSK